MSTVTTTKSRNNSSVRPPSPKALASVESKSDRIRRRAYEIFLARQGGPGDHLSDWLQAEQESSGASHDTVVVVRSRGLSGGDTRAGLTPQPIRDGILDSR